jgi:hypothetical protein
MKPIDTIRNKIDPDLHKYHDTTLCRILRKEDVTFLRGVGLCALVHPINKYVPEDKKYVEPDSMVKVVIINRPGIWWENDLINKFLVLVMNKVKDSSDLGVGILIPTTLPANEKIWGKSKSAEGSTLNEKKKTGVMTPVGVKKPPKFKEVVASAITMITGNSTFQPASVAAVAGERG